MTIRSATRNFFKGVSRLARDWVRRNWDRLYRLRSYVNSSLWVVPFFAILVEQVIVRLTGAAGDWLVDAGHMSRVNALFGFSLSGARSGLETIITLSLSFLVFTFGTSAGCDPGGRRAVHAPGHRHHLSKQRGPGVRGPVR